MLLDCARAADEAGLDSLWVTDHIAIPPDDAEGSGGRYLDPLATLAFLAGATDRIGLGTGVLILPYRPPLPTAKWVATVQELSAGRLLLGVGVGWMEAEFRAVGAAKRRRGADSDATLAFLRRCFDGDPDADEDVVEANGQRFLFRPRPARPPIYVGGAPPHAFERALRYGDGWMPMGANPAKLRPQIETLHRLARERNLPEPEVVSFGALPLDDPSRAADRLDELAGIGVTRFVQGVRYDDAATYRRCVEALAKIEP